MPNIELNQENANNVNPNIANQLAQDVTTGDRYLKQKIQNIIDTINQQIGIDALKGAIEAQNQALESLQK